MDERKNKEFRRSLIKQIILSCLMLSIQITIFFISAGHFDIPRAWLFFSVTFVYLIVSTTALFKLNPELLVQRLKRKREGSKLWDEILVRVCNLTVLIVVPAIAGLDVGRFHWSNIDVHFAVVGLVLFAISTVILNWAMIANPYFEPAVRIQKDRGHRAIANGPYRIVRHPGYLVGIFYILSVPLIVGSVFTFIPAGIYAFLMIIRTLLEDSTLCRELDGYSEYAKRVRYRLLPGIW